MNGINFRSDGLILNVSNTQIGDAQIRYTYIPICGAGYRHFSLRYVIQATTLTIEACNVGDVSDADITGTATGTDGTGATLICSTLNTVNGFTDGNDLVGAMIQITSDATNTGNNGLVRQIIGYTAASGALTLGDANGLAASALPAATTSGVTQFRIYSNPSVFGRKVAYPSGLQWIDISTNFGAATYTSSHAFETSQVFPWEIIRIKRLTTNATNALALRLMRFS